MNKKLLATILGILVGSLAIFPTFSFAEEQETSEKISEANCDEYKDQQDNGENIMTNNKKVIVIGAGTAGLAAARHLDCKGYDVTVLEAKDRIGGRLFTDRSFGFALDRGASWIHGIEGSPIFNLATKYDIRGDLIITNQESAVTYDSDGDRADDRAYNYFEDFANFLERESSNAEKSDSLELAAEKFIEENEITDEEEIENFYYDLYSNYELDNGSDAINSTLLYYDDFAEYPSVEVIFGKGYDQIIDILSEGLDIQTESVVNKIDYTNSKVNVWIEGRDEPYEADYVINTVPLGVLKSGKISFVPEIKDSNQLKQNAIDNLEMGMFNKVYLIFPAIEDEKELVWYEDKDIDWISRIPKVENRGEWMWFLNFYKYTKQPVLLGFVSGSHASKLTNLDDDENEEDKKIAEQGLEVLKTIYEERVPPIDQVKYIVQQWEEDSFTLGAFTHFRKGADPSDFDALAESLKNNDGNNKVFFAGEATIQHLFSTVNGAYVSGIRAAEEIQNENEIIDMPEKQLEYGMHPAFVVCEDNHVLILKTISYKPFCVAKEIADTLVTKRWLKGEPWATYPSEFPFADLEEAANSK